MGWIKKVPKPHTCAVPINPSISWLPAGTWVGSIWECDECRKRWIIADENTWAVYTGAVD